MFDNLVVYNCRNVRNTAVGGWRKIMKRNVLLAILAILITLLIVSCNMSGISAPSEYQNLTISPAMNTASTASLIPSTPTPAKLRFELWHDGNADTKTTLDYAGPDASYVLEDVPVGTYDIYVYGLDSEEREIMKGGPKTFTVKPNSSNNVSINLDFLAESTGSLSVTISWNPSELSDSPISDAIESGRLGFLGFFGSGEHAGETLRGDKVDDGQVSNLIHRVDNVSTGTYEYTEVSVPSTGDEGADIYFIVYTWDDNGDVIALAKTFYTSVTVYDNLESVPDANETYNFRLDGSTIEGYISNVSAATVKAEPDPSSPKDTLIVTWENPVFSDDIYPITVSVWLTDESGRIIGSKESFDYADKTAAEKNGSAKFGNLSSLKKYDVWFSVEGSIGYSKEEIKLENVNPKIGVQSISFPEDFASAYTAGQSIEIVPVFTPEEATDKSFTVSVKDKADDGLTIDGAKVTFSHAGSYTLVITSGDNPDASAELPVTVKLGKPSSVSAEANDTGILVKWSAVEDAEGYKIVRTAGDGSIAEFTSGNEKVEYTDLAVFGGEKYSYSVQAIKNDDSEGLYTGEAVVSAEVEIPVFGIQVILPTVATADFGTVLQQIANEYMNIKDTEKDSITIGFSGEVEYSDGVKADTYTWKLNGTVLKSGNYSEAGIFTLDYTNLEHAAAFHIGSDDSVNSLIIEISADGKKPRTSTAYFHVLKGNPGTVVDITDADGDGRVVYNSSEDRTEKLTLNLKGNTIEPLISWSVAEDDKDIVSIDKNGNVTSLKMGSATVTAEVLATGETAEFEVVSYVPAKTIKIVDNGSKDLIFPSNSVDILDESIYKRQLAVEVTAVNGETVPSEYIGKYSSAIEWTSGDTSALTVTNGFIEAKGKAINSVTITAASSDDSSISDSISYATIELDITVEGTRTYGNEEDIVGSWITSPTARKLSLWSANDYLTSDNFSLKGFSGRWAITNGWEAGKEPEEKTEIKNTNSIYIRLTDCTDFTANAYRRSISDEPTICNIISWNGKAVATVHFKAGYAIQ